ncbi:APC6 [Scenedesmus sp. PABB004]|nr:APC6 [Scenedesmus sp. PABB004]
MAAQPEQLRCLVQDCVAKHLYATAVFFADKLVSLTDHAPGDVYLLAQTYFVSRQHRRGVMLLRAHGLLEDGRFRYLTAKCLAEVGEWDEVLGLLGDGELNDEPTADEQGRSQGHDVAAAAAVCLLRGKAYEALENRQRAIASYKAALQADPFCQEAFAALVDNHMLTNAEELALLDSLPLRPEDRWLGLLYRAQCKKYLQHDSMDAVLEELQAQPGGATAMAAEPTTPTGAEQEQQAQQAHQAQQAQQQAQQQESQAQQRHDCEQQQGAPGLPGAPSGGCGLGSNPDVLAARADWLLHLGRADDAYALTSGILASDPYASQALTTHLAAALALGKKNELFLRGHKLVEEYPEAALSWYSVGVYYMATRQYDQARAFFAKATQLDRHSAAAWIGFGHAFAEQDESDQALAAYRTAARLFPGLHAPLLGMGCAYTAMNNLHLAERCLLQAHAVCPHDPAVAHELGVLAYRGRQYDAAASWLARALELLPGGRPTPAWEATVVALAHARRKQRRYGEALALYETALGLNPSSAGTYAGLGFTHQLLGAAGAAVEAYHKALGLRPDDAFASEMLGLALQEEAARFGAELAAADEPELGGGDGRY